MGVAEGQLLAGKYRVERVLGQGGMGVVVAAHHVVLDETVAIKFLLPEALGSAEAVARFEREARAAVKIKSEHVARVTDVGRLDTGAPYMVMELLRGRDLDELLRDRGPLPLADVADYVLQAGEAIAEAHGLGIVHRDLKPPNLFLTERADGSSCVKVLDFGISKLTAAGSNDQGMTSTSAIMGSPLYMSPEQLMSSRDVDMRTDIWALGVICYELLTGNRPFSGDSLAQLCMAIQLNPPTPLRTYRQDLPPQVEPILLRCLAKNPVQRYANLSELANELVQFAPAHARVSAERIARLTRAAGFLPNAPVASQSGATVAIARPPVVVEQTIGEFGHTRATASSSKVPLMLGLGTVLAIAVAGAFAFSRRVPPKLEPAASSTALNASLPGASAAPVVPVVSAAEPQAPPATITPSPPADPPPRTASTVAPLAAQPRHFSAKVVAPKAIPTVAPTNPVAVTPPDRPDCGIPYFYDERGNKVFKKGCL
jgi:serine/threonine-protein kinase